MVARRDVVAVVHGNGTRSQQTQVLVHGVLVQAQQQVELVAVAVLHFFRHTEGQEDVTASHDGLVRVVRVQVQAAPHEYPREDVPRRCYPLSSLASDGEGKIKSAHSSSLCRSRAAAPLRVPGGSDVHRAALCGERGFLHDLRKRGVCVHDCANLHARTFHHASQAQLA